MDLITGQRTFFLGVSSTSVDAGGTNGTIHIPFRDSSGNLIRCNYFKVDVASNLNTNCSGAFVAEPSGLSIFRRVGNNLPCYNVTALPSSGICGVGSVFVGGGTAEWHGGNGEVCNSITIRAQASPTATLLFGVTYGNLLPFNPLKITGFSNLGQYGTEYDKGR